MSQVQPPRSRPSNARPATIQLLRWGILNVGALVVTMLLVRIAITVAMPNPRQTGLMALLRVTHLMVWPLELLTPLDASLTRGLNVASVLTLAIIIVIWIAALGVVAGWEREGRRMRSVASGSRARP